MPIGSTELRQGQPDMHCGRWSQEKGVLQEMWHPRQRLPTWKPAVLSWFCIFLQTGKHLLHWKELQFSPTGKGQRRTYRVVHLPGPLESLISFDFVVNISCYWGSLTSLKMIKSLKECKEKKGVASHVVSSSSVQDTESAQIVSLDVV